MEGALTIATAEAESQADLDRLRIWELIPNPIEACRLPPRGARLNMVTPFMSRQGLTGGGPATALRFFQRLAPAFTNSRIIVTHETESDFELSDWPGLSRDEGPQVAHSIVFLGDRTTPLQVGAEDFFIATWWPTAVLVRDVLARQAQWFQITPRRHVYLIQDYEPGFYPWSARYVGAESTYSDAAGTIAVFNTDLLAQHFASRGLRFSQAYVFHPVLHPELRRRKAALHAFRKERLILVYGRPSEPRNDFDLAVDALRIWAREYPDAAQWSVLSAGERHPDVILSPTVTLQSGGKLSLDEYADRLSRCWVGLSLMFSPHPSYPPLEMAEFGAWVITNRFAGKDPSLLAPSLIGVSGASPREVAEQLAWCCGQYQPGRLSAVEATGPLFRTQGDEFPFARELADSWNS